MQPLNDTPEPLKPFSATLQELRFGNLDEELAKEVKKMMLACNETQRPGVLTLKLKFVPGNAGQIEIADDYVSKPPKLARPTTLGFLASNGAFTREDPRQVPIPGLVRLGQSLDTSTGEVKTIPPQVVAPLVAVK